MAACKASTAIFVASETAAEIYKREAVSRLPLVRLEGQELLKVFHGDLKQLQ